MATTPATGTALLPAGSSVRVLLVDDDPVARRASRGLLELAGLLVVAEAGDGHTALALAGRMGPTVVVVDLALRLTLVQQLRWADPLLMVVVHTRITDLRVHRAAYGAGAIHVLRKGGSGGALVAAVRAAHAARSGLRRSGGAGSMPYGRAISGR